MKPALDFFRLPIVRVAAASLPVALGLGIPVPAHAVDIRIDFGHNTSNAPSGWNEIGSTIGTESGVLTDFNTSAPNGQGITVIGDEWFEINANTQPWNGGNDRNWIANTAADEFLNTQDSGGQLIFRNLNPDHTYRVELLSAQNLVSGLITDVWAWQGNTTFHATDANATGNNGDDWSHFDDGFNDANYLIWDGLKPNNQNTGLLPTDLGVLFGQTDTSKQSVSIGVLNAVRLRTIATPSSQLFIPTSPATVQTGAFLGDAGTPGRVELSLVPFGEGTFTAAYQPDTWTNFLTLTPGAVDDPEDAAALAAIAAAGGDVQWWDLDYTGVIGFNNGDGAVVTLTYDDGDLVIAEQDLALFHLRDGDEWEQLDIAIDTVANTITFNGGVFDLGFFSPFALGVVPEPAAATVFIISLCGIGTRRVRSACSKPTPADTRKGDRND